VLHHRSFRSGAVSGIPTMRPNRAGVGRHAHQHALAAHRVRRRGERGRPGRPGCPQSGGTATVWGSTPRSHHRRRGCAHRSRPELSGRDGAQHQDRRGRRPLISAEIPTARPEQVAVGQTAALDAGSSHTPERCGTNGRPGRRFATHLRTKKRLWGSSAAAPGHAKVRSGCFGCPGCPWAGGWGRHWPASWPALSLRMYSASPYIYEFMASVPGSLTSTRLRSGSPGSGGRRCGRRGTPGRAGGTG
jgi:hypothetical protein